MSSFLLGVPGRLKTLLDRMTAARAARLDADISSRMPGTTTQRDRIDTTVSSRAPSTDTSTLLSRLTSTRAARLDADVSSRASSTQATDVENAVNQRPTQVVKSVQTGVVDVDDLAVSLGQQSNWERWYVDVTISAVDESKSVPSVIGSTQRNGRISGATAYAIGARLINSTTLRVGAAGIFEEDGIYGRWTVVEFE